MLAVENLLQSNREAPSDLEVWMRSQDPAMQARLSVEQCFVTGTLIA